MLSDVFIVSCKVFQILLAPVGFALNTYILLLIPFSPLTVYNCLLTCLAFFHCFLEVFIFAYELGTLLTLYFNLLPPHLFWHLTPQTTLYNLQTIIWTSFPIVNLWIIAALVVDRYFLIAIAPFRYNGKITKFKAFILCLFFTFLLFLLSLQFWISLPVVTVEQWTSGIDLTLNVRKLAVQSICFILFFIFAFLLPSSLIILCNIHLLTIILDHRNRIVNNNLYVVQLSNSNDYQTKKMVKNKSSHLLIMLNLFCTLLLVFPYFACLLCQVFFQITNQHLIAISQLLLTFSPIVNGYVYALKNDSIKKAFGRSLQKYLHKMHPISKRQNQKKVQLTTVESAKSLTSILPSTFELHKQV